MRKWNKYCYGGSGVLWCCAAGDCDLSTASTDELLCNPETDAGAENSLGGEEGLEDARQIILVDADAGVADDDLDAIQGSSEYVASGDGENSALFHGIDGVRDYIREHLKHLTFADTDLLQVVEAGVNCDVG